MYREELVAKIMQRKEFSQLPTRDVEKALGLFVKEIYSDEEKVKKTRCGRLRQQPIVMLKSTHIHINRSLEQSLYFLEFV